MNIVKIGVILTIYLLHAITSTQSASCRGRSISAMKCDQSCGLDECYCNATNDELRYDTCNQTCSPPVCSGNKMTCIAEKNCSQTCKPGNCVMRCNSQGDCDQKADDNGAKVMSCSSKSCSQSCMEGHCDTMYCDAHDCHQTCGKGGCTMNCTASVKRCSQSCSSHEKCTLECRAEVCHQQCSGPRQCIIVNAEANAAPSQVYLHFPLINIICFLLLIKQSDYM